MPSEKYPDHAFKPHNLTKEEIAEPRAVIYDFFTMSHLPEHREQLTEMFDLMITGNYNKLLNRRERSDMVYFFRRLEKMIEAVYILNGGWEKVWGDEKEVNLNDGKDKETTT